MIQTGVIVAIDTDNGTNPPIYFVEKDDKYKIGMPEKDCVWCNFDEIALCYKRDLES